MFDAKETDLIRKAMAWYVEANRPSVSIARLAYSGNSTLADAAKGRITSHEENVRRQREVLIKLDGV